MFFYLRDEFRLIFYKVCFYVEDFIFKYFINGNYEGSKLIFFIVFDFKIIFLVFKKNWLGKFD